MVKSKILQWDAACFFVLILRTVMFFRPLRVFSTIVLLSLLVGFTKMGIDLSHQPNISASAQLALMRGLIILLIGLFRAAIATRLGPLNPNAIAGVKPDNFLPAENAGESIKKDTGAAG